MSGTRLVNARHLVPFEKTRLAEAHPGESPRPPRKRARGRARRGGLGPADASAAAASLCRTGRGGDRAWLSLRPLVKHRAKRVTASTAASEVRSVELPVLSRATVANGRGFFHQHLVNEADSTGPPTRSLSERGKGGPRLYDAVVPPSTVRRSGRSRSTWRRASTAQQQRSEARGNAEWTASRRLRAGRHRRGRHGSDRRSPISSSPGRWAPARS